MITQKTHIFCLDTIRKRAQTHPGRMHEYAERHLERQNKRRLTQPMHFKYLKERTFIFRHICQRKIFFIS
jgi:hypothetical protein